MNKKVDLRQILALDFGSKTVGVAATDALGLTAQALETIWREREHKLRRTYARIEEIIAERGIRLIIVGFPLNMDDSEGERARLTREFAQELERRVKIPVMLYDERLSTLEASEILEERGIPAKRRKESLDMLSAQLILERYMEDERCS